MWNPIPLRRSGVPLAPMLLFLLVLGGCREEADTPLVIGLAAPLEAGYGKAILAGARIAAGEINAAGGIRGRRLEILPQDDAADPQQALRVAYELRADPRVVAVVGHATSGAMLAAAPVYNDPEIGVVAVTPTASSPKLSSAGPWIFRACPSDLAHGPALASYLRSSRSVERVQILFQNDEYGRGVEASFRAAFERLGGRVVASDPYLPAMIGTDETLDPYLARAIGRGSQAAVVLGFADAAVPLIRGARRLGFAGPILGADGLIDLREEGSLAEGVLMTASFLPRGGGERATHFERLYAASHGSVPTGGAASAYDAVHLLGAALLQGATRKEVREYLAGMGTRTPAFAGATGTIGFDAQGDATGIEPLVGILRGGELVAARR